MEIAAVTIFVAVVFALLVWAHEAVAPPPPIPNKKPALTIIRTGNQPGLYRNGNLIANEGSPLYKDYLNKYEIEEFAFADDAEDYTDVWFAQRGTSFKEEILYIKGLEW